MVKLVYGTVQLCLSGLGRSHMDNWLFSYWQVRKTQMENSRQACLLPPSIRIPNLFFQSL